MEAVSRGDPAGTKSQHGDWDGVVAEQQDDRAHWSYEFRAVRTPTHALRDGQPCDGLGDDAAQEFGRGGAGFRAAKREPRALVRGQALETADVHPAALGKRGGG